MFVLKKENTFTWPVDVKVPGDRQQETQRFYCRFKVVSKKRLKQLSGTTPEAADDALFKDVVVGWDPETVRDGAGKPIPFSAKTLAQLIDIPYVRLAIADAYFNAIVGRGYPAKN